MTAEDNRLLRALVVAGWKQGEDAAEGFDVIVRYPILGMQVWANGLCIVNDSDNPLPPEGWWDALTNVRDVCAVIVAEKGSLGLRSMAAVSADAFNEARICGRTATAIGLVQT